MEKYYQNYSDAIYASLNLLEIEDGSGNTIENDAGFDNLCKISEQIQNSGATQYFCGNGASASFSNHMSIDWSKNGKVPTRSFNDSALLTAIVNDIGADELFATALELYAISGDLLVTISSSGNSPNIIRAIEKARELSMKVVTFTGLKPDNAARKLGDLNFYIPAKTYGIVECSHQILLHIWLDQFMGITEWNRDTVQNMRKDSYKI